MPVVEPPSEATPDASGSPLKQPAKTISRRLTVVVSLGLVLLILGVMLFRLSYPYELEWMEGGCLEHTQQILDGKPLYGEPTDEFVPFIYTPFYFYVSAALAPLLGKGFLTLRLVSLLSTLGACAVIYGLLRRETGSRYAGWIAAAGYLATFSVSGYWFDVARVDSLFMFLLLSGLALIRLARSNTGLIAAGVILTLAFLTKQTTLVIAIPFFVCLASRDGKRAAVSASTFIIGVIGTSLAFHFWSSGWFSYYVFNLPRQHAILWEVTHSFWWKDLLASIPTATAVSIGMCLWLLRGTVQGGSGAKRQAFYLGLALGCVAGAWSSRLHSGGYANVLLPAYAAAAVLLGLFVAEFERTKTPALHWLVGVVVAAHFAILVFDPRAMVPSADDRAAGDAIVRRIQDQPGEVLVPYHGYLTRRAGKKSTAHKMAAEDVQRGTDALIGRTMMRYFLNKIRARHYALIILDEEQRWLPQIVNEHYKPAGKLLDDDDTFLPVTGTPLRPLYLFVPR